MTRILYRPLGEGCAVKLRPIAIDESTPRILPVHRKPAWPHTAIAIDCEAPISVGTLVELDVEFEASSRRFFGRGVVSWATPGASVEKPARLGVVIYSLRPWSGGQTAEAPVAKAQKPPQPQTQSPAPQAALPTQRQEERPDELQPHKKDIALSATAAMLSPLQPLTGSPTIDEIAELLTNLLGEEVKVSRSSTALKVQDVCMLAEYTTEDGETTSVALADLRLANYLGAALAMIPADGAEADVKAQKLVAEVRDNMKEIFNIATSLIAKTGSGHRTLGRVLELKVEQPKGALGAMYQAPPFRYDFDVEVPGYGKGRLTYLSPVMHVTDDDIAAASQAGAPPEPVAVAPKPIATTSDSAAAAPIPTESDLAKLLCSLTGTEVVVDISGSPMPSDEAFVVADYVEDDGSLTGVYLADVKSANYLGAALAMIPANAAEKDAHALKLADEVKENLQEIFNAISGSHHRFRRMYLPHKEDLPKELIAVLSSPASRIDFDLSVPGYGNGKFAALAARSAQQEAATTRGSVETPALDEAPAASREAGSGSEPALEGGVLLPDPQSLGELLTGLVGEEVKVTVQREPVPFQDVVLVGAWQDEARRDRLCFGFDLRIANFLGAALAMIPKDAAHDDIKAQHISDDVFANVNEICSIASGAINQEGSVLLKLNELKRNDAELPAATSRALNGADNRLDLEIELPGYGAGMLAIVVLT